MRNITPKELDEIVDESPFPMWKGVKVRNGHFFSLNTSGKRISPELEYMVGYVTETTTSKGVFCYEEYEDALVVVMASDPKYRDNLPVALIRVIPLGNSIDEGEFKGIDTFGYKAVYVAEAISVDLEPPIVDITKDCTVEILKRNKTDDAFFISVKYGGEMIMSTGMSAAYVCKENAQRAGAVVKFTPDKVGRFKCFRVLKV